MRDNILEPFDYPNEKLWCARCGTECVPTRHITSEFLLCPNHGEFTIAPVVIKFNGEWKIDHRDGQAQGMWGTCRYLDELAAKKAGA